uniref:Transcription elongation regulator 1 n=2 Tax=Plectus sambesii TaxID=2011161 RepID=A0A914VS59_9BILA
MNDQDELPMDESDEPVNGGDSGGAGGPPKNGGTFPPKGPPQGPPPGLHHQNGGGVPPPVFFPPVTGPPRPPPGIPPRGPPPPLGAPRGPLIPARPPGMMPPGGMGGPPQQQPPVNPQQTQQEKLKQILGIAPDQELWVETKADGGKSYYYNAISRKTVWDRPQNATIMTQSEIEAAVQKAQQQQQKPQAMQPPAGMQPPMGYAPPGMMPPPGYPMPPPGMMPPFGMGMGMPPFGMPPFGTDPSSVWQEFTSPDGRKYYFNAQTQETTWDKPQALKDKEAKQTPAAMPNMPAMSAPDGAGSGLPDGLKSAGEKARPISSNPVAGSPWCVVWTGDRKVFFFNPSTRTSVWERPPELYGRPDVDMLVSNPPKDKVAGAPNQQKRPQTDDDDDEENEDEPPVKKRKEKKKEKAKPEKKEKPPPPEPKPLDPAIEAEMKAAKERAQIPIEVRVEKYKTMLAEREVSAFSTWEKELSKIVFDERYLLLGAKERREIFEEYVKERAEVERAERKKKAREAKDGFKALLEDSKLHGKSSFSDFASKYGKDARFKAIEKMRERETLFTDYVSELRKAEKEERRLQKEKHKQDFLALIRDQEGLTRKSKWSDVKKKIDHDPRYKQIDSSSTREEWFKEFAKTLPEETNSDDEEEKARQERLEKKSLTAAEQAILDRQKEVEAELGEQMKERNKELERHKHQEAEDHYKALLVDTVKASDSHWRETRRQLRKDKRWELADLLDKEQKERLFDDHIRSLEKKRKEAFYQLLNDCEGVTLTSHWREVRKMINDDPRYSKLCASERRAEREFRDYMADKMSSAKSEFRDLLRETKIITYKSKQTITENEQHLKDILSTLENDKRYLVLDCCPEEREKLLEAYLDDLDRRGPPPPPTQQEPSRRGPK